MRAVKAALAAALAACLWLTPSAASASVANVRWDFTKGSDFHDNFVFTGGNPQPTTVSSLVDDPDLVYAGGGFLNMSAKRDADGSWRGTRYRSKHMYQGGTFEARIRTPKGQGAWPAFWLVDAYQPAPCKGCPEPGTKAEIDIMETINDGNVAYQSIHNWSGVHKHLHTDTPTVDWTGWHDYKVVWYSTSITFYVDGVMTKRYTPADMPEWPFATPMYIVLDVYVGGDWAGAPDASTPDVLTMKLYWLTVNGWVLA